MKHITTLLFLFLWFDSDAQADKEPDKPSLVIDGKVVVTTDGKAAYLNFGGVGITFDLNRKVAASINMLPSIGFSSQKTVDEYQNARSTIVAKPVLGIGLQFSAKRFILSFPLYYKLDSQVWVATAGIGYHILKI
ncbi:MAG: hypothetical protein SH856_12030 [Flavobacteriales bacterium]|nr:hypothetical protein [Flavobacteriales bacterium]